MMRYAKAIGLSVVLFAAVSAEGVSDTTSETRPSVEWLVYKSDAIVVGTVVDTGDGKTQDGLYQVSEILMSHEQVRIADKLRVKDKRNNRGDQAVLFLTSDGERLTTFHVSSLAHPRKYKYTHYANLRYQSDPIVWYGIDEWGVLIDSPEKLKAKIKKLIGTPWEDRLEQPLASRKGATEVIKCRSPADWEYEDEGGYDVSMTITIPPIRVLAWREGPTTQTIAAAEATPAERQVLALARQMRDEEIERFTFAEADDPTLGKKCQISPDGRHLLVEQRVRPDETRWLYALDAEKRILTLQNAVGTCSFSASGKYFWYRLRQMDDRILLRLFDLAEGRIVFEATDFGFQGWYGNWVLNEEETRIGRWYNAPVLGKHEAVIWDIESRQELFRNTGDFLEFTPGDKYVILRQKDEDSEHCRRLFEIAGRDLVLTLPNTRFVVSRDDRLYAYTEEKTIDGRSEDRAIIIRRLPSDEFLRRFDFDNPIRIDRFLDDGRSLALSKWRSPLSTGMLGHAVIVDAFGDDERRARVQFAKPH